MVVRNLEADWAEFLATRDRQARERLIEFYHSTLVKSVVKRISRSFPSYVDREDLISYGTFGLIDALDRFDPSRGRFEAFAAARIRGAVLDELRDMDWVPRSIRAKDKKIKAEASRLQAEQSRHVTYTEAASSLGVDQHGSTELRWGITSLDHDTHGDGVSMAETLADAVQTEGLMVGADVRARAARAIAALDDRSKALLALYYIGNANLGEIGKIFGVTESRVCQLQGQALAAFGARFAAH